MRLGVGSVCGVALLVMAAAIAPATHGQTASTLNKDMIGQWELSTAERSKTCVITLKGDTTPQGQNDQQVIHRPAAPAIDMQHRDIDVVRLFDDAQVAELVRAQTQGMVQR